MGEASHRSFLLQHSYYDLFFLLQLVKGFTNVHLSKLYLVHYLIRFLVIVTMLAL